MKRVDAPWHPHIYPNLCRKMVKKMTKIEDYDFTKPKNKKAFRELERKKNSDFRFPRGSNFREIAQVIGILVKEMT